MIINSSPEKLTYERLDPISNRLLRKLHYHELTYELPACIGNRYEIKQIFSVGGMGLLLKAHDVNLFYREVLIKTPLVEDHWFDYPNNRSLPEGIKEKKKGAEYERKMFFHARHRNIAAVPTLIDWVYDINPMIIGPHRAKDGREFIIEDRQLWENWPYLVLNYIDAQPLNIAINKNQRWHTQPLKSALNLATKLAKILKLFHTPQEFKNVKDLYFLYLDLKPSNILTTDEGNIFLIDLGSLRHVSEGRLRGDPPALTEIYCAPEFNRSSEPVPAPTMDVYSFGVVLEECIQTARRATFDAKKPPDSTLPNAWRNFLQKARDPYPNNRFQNMNEIIDQLKNLPIE